MLFMLAGLKKVQHFRSVITVTVESRVNEKLSVMMKSCEVTSYVLTTFPLFCTRFVLCKLYVLPFPRRFEVDLSDHVFHCHAVANPCEIIKLISLLSFSGIVICLHLPFWIVASISMWCEFFIESWGEESILRTCLVYRCFVFVITYN